MNLATDSALALAVRPSAVRLAADQQVAAQLVARACADALDFGTDLRAGYVQCCFETWQREQGAPALFAHCVRVQLARLGFDF